MKISVNLVLKYLRAACFVIFFSWISFFPQPIQDRYAICVRISLGIFLFILILNKEYRKPIFSFKDWPLWLFLISLSAGTICATDKNAALGTYFYLVIILFFIFYIGKGLSVFRQDRNTVSMTICVCSSLVALFGILEVIYAFNPIYEYWIDNPFYERYICYPVRPMSTQLNPAPLATYLLFALPFGIYIFRQKSLIKKILGIIAIVLNIVCLILTFSRGSFLGLVSMLLFYQLIKKKYKLLLISFIIIIIISVAAYFLPYPINRISPQGIGIYGTGIFSKYRTSRMAMSWRMLKDSPIFGVGLNHFRILFDKYYPVKADLQYIPYEIKIADNMHLTLMAETGILGLTGFIIFIFSLFKRGLKYCVSLEDENKKQILLLFMSALIGLLVSMAGYELFYWNNPFVLFCLACGFIQGFMENGIKS